MAQPRHVGHREDLKNITYPKPKQGCGSSDAGRAKTRQAQQEALWARAHEALQGGLENPDVLADEAPVLRGTALPHPSGKHPALNLSLIHI